MLRPSYTDLLEVLNNGEYPDIKSRYSIVIAASKRARQIIAGAEPMVRSQIDKPVTIAVNELHQGKLKIKPQE
jgi:DNA-directed RNA polymerase subunit omega